MTITDVYFRLMRNRKRNNSYEKQTFEYFLSLTLEYQERYYKENLYLRYYKDTYEYGLTDDRYINAKHAAEISRITGVCFNDKDKIL